MDDTIFLDEAMLNDLPILKIIDNKNRSDRYICGEDIPRLTFDFEMNGFDDWKIEIVRSF